NPPERAWSASSLALASVRFRTGSSRSSRSKRSNHAVAWATACCGPCRAAAVGTTNAGPRPAAWASMRSCSSLPGLNSSPPLRTSNPGTFVLRIDDTDMERNRPEYEALIYESLRWLALDWDEGPDKGGPHAPYRQSERVDIYREEAARLIKEGHAYRCYCTPEELEAERRQAQAEKRAYKYSRRCLTNPPEGRSVFAVRFQVPGGEIRFTDMVRGEMRFDADLIGDFIIVKSDGYPTYQFASPVDDARMEITHVIRGEEHLANTPYQLMLVDALGYPR